MIAKENAPQVGTKAPEFLVETPNGKLPLHQLAAQHQKGRLAG